jgi:RNA polymerase sigma-70 factor (ECF subfamily)
MGPIGPELLGRLFDERAAALVLYARQWSDRPEDIVQDAFVALARQRRLPERVVPWLYRVVRNGAIAAARSDRRRRRREALASDREAWFASADARIDAAAAAGLLAELDLETREAIVARLWGGLTFEEIARLQHCSLTTTHRRYQAGLARLQEKLECPSRELTSIPKTT